MHELRARRLALLGVLIATFLSAAWAEAAPLTWGVNGVGGSGNWDTSTANWFNGSTNVKWPDGGDAVFAGASGGTVKSFFFGPVVSSMTFNTPGYVVQDGWIQGGTNGLTVTTNVDATISSLLANSTNGGDVLIKNGTAALIANGTVFLGKVQVNQGEYRVTGSSSLFFSTVNLANTPGAAVTLGQTSSSVIMGGLGGGGSSGGIVRPDSQSRTVTLQVFAGSTFAGSLQDNGSGILGVNVLSSSNGQNTPQVLTNVNTYSGPTAINQGTLAFAGNGSALNSQAIAISGGTLLLDNSGAVLGNRLSDSTPVQLNAGAIQLKGNSATGVQEALGPLTLFGASSITVTQPGSAAAQLTFAGLQRSGHATLNVVGPGVSLVGLTNGTTGIVAPYVTAGNEWATVGPDSHIAAWNTYTPDINSGSTSDHVKVTASGTTSVTADTTRASLNMQNSTAVAQTVDLAGHNLGLTSGGILSSGAGSGAISNGILSTSASELIVTANNRMTIASSIADNGSGLALVKNGIGVLTLSGTNSYTGSTVITQGTLAVSADANLGMGSAIEFGGGTLQAAGSFSSAKGFASGALGNIDTAGFNVTFSGANNGGLNKIGLGTLTLTNPATGTTSLNAGVLNLPNATSGRVALSNGTLQAAGTLLSLDVAGGILDIAGTSAGTLTTQRFSISSNSNFRIDFGLGSQASDFWAITNTFFFPSNPAAFQFEFQNLGGVSTGVEYPLMSFPAFFPPATNLFAFAPDMAAQGWAGTFKTTSTGVSVTFSAVPEPSTFLLAALGFIGLAARSWHRRRSR